MVLGTFESPADFAAGYGLFDIRRVSSADV
jgi:hypothetical protein